VRWNQTKIGADGDSGVSDGEGYVQRGRGRPYGVGDLTHPLKDHRKKKTEWVHLQNLGKGPSGGALEEKLIGEEAAQREGGN